MTGRLRNADDRCDESCDGDRERKAGDTREAGADLLSEQDARSPARGGQRSSPDPREADLAAPWLRQADHSGQCQRRPRQGSRTLTSDSCHGQGPQEGNRHSSAQRNAFERGEHGNGRGTSHRTEADQHREVASSQVTQPRPAHGNQDDGAETQAQPRRSRRPDAAGPPNRQRRTQLGREHCRDCRDPRRHNGLPGRACEAREQATPPVRDRRQPALLCTRSGRGRRISRVPRKALAHPDAGTRVRRPRLPIQPRASARPAA